MCGCEYNTRNQIDEPKALDHVKRADYKLTSTIASDVELESVLARHAIDDSYQTVTANEEFSRFCDAVRQLPLQCRRVFVLKKIYGCSQREIAGEMGIAESNTVAARSQSSWFRTDSC